MILKQSYKFIQSDVLIISYKNILDIPILKGYSKYLKNIFKEGKNMIYSFLIPSNKISNIIIYSLDKNEESFEEIRKMGGKLRKILKNEKTCTIYLGKGEEINLKPLLEGFLLASYKFDKYKKIDKNSIKKIAVSTPKTKKDFSSVLGYLNSIYQSIFYVRDLVNRPGNDVIPEVLANESKVISKADKRIKVTVLDEKKLKKNSFHALLSVGQSSKHPPRLIILNYKSKLKNAKTIALVGKGLTFDTGGLNLKPGSSITDMKFDMAGAATVLGIFKMLSLRNELPVNLIGVIGAAENSISDKATRPGDIISSYAGKTIEITNTDAEGRLVLADAISYTIDKHKIDKLYDIATLTGGCIAALGYDITGVLTNKEDEYKLIEKSSKNTDEKVWLLPLDKDYIKKTKGDISDLKNYNKGFFADTIMAAGFLSHFVKNTPWVHFDIAGTSFSKSEKEYITKGGTGCLVRLIWDLLNNID